MQINYQIMTENQKNFLGKYIPDFDKLIEGATCQEEIDYIHEVSERFDMYTEKGREDFVGFAFNMVYITRQQCGHFEIFQIPCNEHYTVEENLKLAEEHAEKMNCTRCTCGW